jgi:hypothetical protein
MSTKLGIFVTAHYSPLLRCFVVILGCMAVAWGLFVFPIFWHESSIERTANQIIAGDLFKGSLLAGLFPIIVSIESSTYCRPSAVRSAAIIELRMAEGTAPANNLKHVDGRLRSLNQTIRSSLSCSPSDPFLWLVLYWSEGTQDGFRSEDLKYLRMSYLLGPNEGWIALKRNGITFAVSEKLPVDLAEYAIIEFVGLIEMGFYEQAAEIFTGPAWRVREQLLPRLQNIEERHRQAFANILYTKGYDVVVPGIKRQGSRPWP